MPANINRKIVGGRQSARAGKPAPRHRRQYSADKILFMLCSYICAKQSQLAEELREMIMTEHGTFGWNELMTSDLEASKAFYAKVAGWTYQDIPMAEGSYTLAFVEGNPVPVAGLMHWAESQPGSNDWFAYINVADINAAVNAVTGAGGSVMRAPFEIESTGWIAVVIDTTHTAIGLLEPKPMA